jgi:iron-sulfur cluster assembly protein
LITVTEEAKALIGAQDIPEGSVLRLDPVNIGRATEDGRIGFAAGEPRDDDQVVEHEGEEVLRIAAPVSGLLSGRTMDVMVEEPQNGSDGPSVGLGILPPADPELLTDDS